MMLLIALLFILLVMVLWYFEERQRSIKAVDWTEYNEQLRIRERQRADYLVHRYHRGYRQLPKQYHL
jgi:uncharacterized membrane protein